MIETSEDEVRGINTKAQLAEAEQVMQARLRKAALEAGVTMIAPETVYLAADTTFGKDVTIEPFVVIGPGVSIADGAVIHSFSHIVQASIGKNASVGPYARLRPGTSLGEGAQIGNFVETKAATLEAGVKVNHLSYIGDAHVGANANIGAGTITCNYDGFSKHRTEIGAGAFVGTNSSLVAPVKIGNGAYIGSGSVITRDVPDDALAVERSQQTNREGGARRYRDESQEGAPKELSYESSSLASLTVRLHGASILRRLVKPFGLTLSQSAIIIEYLGGLRFSLRDAGAFIFRRFGDIDPHVRHCRHFGARAGRGADGGFAEAAGISRL